MKVLLTGATGFVGARVAARLAQGGVALRVTLRRGSDAGRLAGVPAEHVLADLSDEAALRAACHGVDAVVHAAGLTRARSEAALHAANADGSARLARAALDAGAGRFVYLGSLAARGPDPVAGDAGTTVRASPGDAPRSAYARSKLEGERQVQALAPAGWAASLRPSAVYGPGDRDLLPLFALARRGVLALPPGGGRVQPVYVDDVAELVARVLASDATGFGPWPVAEPRAYAWRDLPALLAAAVGRDAVRTVHLPPVAFRFAAYASETWAWLRGTAPELDLRRARDLAERSYTTEVASTMDAFGWTAPTALADGARATAAWYAQQGWM
ncbi:MAG: NAD-dependent epimerase/dehydratase family protein [Trueperaceae bacterium]|nr:NAD-dependent epimerase/dehydratase family protein [Trueperaceae bacterium]